MPNPGPERADPSGLSGRSAQSPEPVRAAEALGDLAIGIDASLSGEIDGPVQSVSDHRTPGALRSSRAHSESQVLPLGTRDRSALASREKCPCFPPLMRSPPTSSGVQQPPWSRQGLTARGVRTARGGDWTAVQVSDILRR
jgi:hypothetical protein